MWRLRQQRRSKYNSHNAEYKGVTYHSKKERDYAYELDMRLKAGEIKGIQRQVCIALDVGDYHIANYYIDFIIEHNDGTTEYVEVKGFSTDVWRLKWRLFEALFGDRQGVRLTVVK